MKKSTPSNKARRPSVYDVKGLAVIRRLARESASIASAFPPVIDPFNRADILLVLITQRLRGQLLAILKLGDSRETWLIARSALEGIALLCWLNEQDQQLRAKRFDSIGLREQYCRYLSLKKIGLNLEGTGFEDCQKQLLNSKYAPLTPKERQIIKRGGSIDGDSTHELLTKKKTRQLLVASIGEYYTISYWDRFSEFHHWNARTLGGLINVDHSVTYSGEGQLLGALALEAGFLAFHTSLHILNRRFKLDLGAALVTLGERWESWRHSVPDQTHL